MILQFLKLFSNIFKVFEEFLKNFNISKKAVTRVTQIIILISYQDQKQTFFFIFVRRNLCDRLLTYLKIHQIALK